VVAFRIFSLEDFPLHSLSAVWRTTGGETYRVLEKHRWKMENDEAGAVWLETRRKKWAISCDLFRFLSAISPTIASFLIDLPPPVNAYKKPRCLQKELAKKIAEIMKLYKVEITCLEKNLRPITRE
jgi:hypothetical protein